VHMVDFNNLPFDNEAAIGLLLDAIDAQIAAAFADPTILPPGAGQQLMDLKDAAVKVRLTRAAMREATAAASAAVRSLVEKSAVMKREYGRPEA